MRQKSMTVCCIGICVQMYAFRLRWPCKSNASPKITQTFRRRITQYRGIWIYNYWNQLRWVNIHTKESTRWKIFYINFSSNRAHWLTSEIYSYNTTWYLLHKPELVEVNTFELTLDRMWKSSRFSNTIQSESKWIHFNINTGSNNTF